MEKKVIEVAAKWWADQLRSKPKFDNGDAMHSFMFSMIAGQIKPLPEDKIEAFERELIKRIESNSYPVMGLGTDYQPDGIIQDACEKAGIDFDNRFPVKTHMWMHDGKVAVSCGYRAPVVQLYPLTDSDKSGSGE